MTGRSSRGLQVLLYTSRTLRLAVAVTLIVVTFVADEILVRPEISLGVLYVLPMMIAATALERRQILALAVICAVLRNLSTSTVNAVDEVLRFIMALAAYLGAGLFIEELVRNRKLALDHVKELERQQTLRREAEEQMRLLAESSPAAILTLDDDARILSANEAARQLLGFGNGQMTGEPIASHLPVLADALKMSPDIGYFRTAAQCSGRRKTGEPFVAQIWFSTYSVGELRRLAAIAVDSSEEVREREEENLRQLLEHNRIIAGAVSHEIRNICGAAAAVYQNLRRVPELVVNEDYRALGSLITALEKIAAMDLRTRSRDGSGSRVDLLELLNQLRVVIEPAWAEIDGEVVWNTPEKLALVTGESFGLMQAFLNLSQNSHRAVQVSGERQLTIQVREADGDVVEVAVSDGGPGVQDRSALFLPFRPGSEGSGLGLYVSRSILRRYGGDLRYDPAGGRCRFIVELRKAGDRSNS